MHRIALIFAVLLSFLPIFSHAEIKLPYLISDGMVVQRNKDIPIWGWGAPNAVVHLVFDGEIKKATSDEQGAWRVHFSPRKAGGPFSLSIKQNNVKTKIKDIWIGDVWLCSGQSNMEFVLRDASNATDELLQATDKNIRHFKVPHSWSIKAENTLVGGEWKTSSPEAAQNFTAVGYFFAKSLREHVDVPIGLIGSNWSGSNIETWMTGPLLGMTDAEVTKNLQSIFAEEKVTRVKVQNNLSQWPNAEIGELAMDMSAVAKEDWSAENVKEDDWINLQVPLLWEQSGFEGMDGVAWYRKAFYLTVDDIQEDLVLHLARIDDNDVTWVNGAKIGSTDLYSLERHYQVSKKHLKVGRNVIAIRVDDTGGGGGIYSDTALSIEVGGEHRSLAGTWKFKVDKAFVALSGNKHHTDTVLYNKMIRPLFNIPIKGVLWYQGESNANDPEQAFEYRHQFQKLINFWRSQWEEDLPFFWVQLANYKSGQDSDIASPWAILRESQTQALSLPKTGQAITIDIGNPDDIHPTDKKTVGKRLASEVLNKIYGKTKIEYRGPVLKEFSMHKNKITVQMNSSSKLTVRQSSRNQISGFTIAGKDKVFHPAIATLKLGSLIVWSEMVEHPLAVRYGWSDNPEDANLMDSSGLPAEPFRTDDW